MRFITGLLLLFCFLNLMGSEDLAEYNRRQNQIACAVLKIALNKTYGKNDLKALEVKKVVRVYQDETRRELFLMLAQVNSYYVLARRNKPQSIDEDFGSVQTMTNYYAFMNVVAKGVLLLKDLAVEHGVNFRTKDDSECLVGGMRHGNTYLEYVFDLQGTLKKMSPVETDVHIITVNSAQSLVPRNPYLQMLPDLRMCPACNIL